MSGLRYESLAQMPEGMRRQVAGKLITQSDNTLPAAENTVPGSETGSARLEWLSERLKENKYHNVNTEVNGIKFDSKKEARRYQQLMAAMELGVIEDLRLQVDFTLIEAYTSAGGERHQALRYRADFTYKVRSSGYDSMPALGYEDIEYWRGLWPGALVVEDVKSKGTKTRVYLNKKKMMADKGYIIREV